MVNVVVVSYSSITQLMNSGEDVEWEHKMVSVSYGVLAFGNLYLIFHLCHVSENLVVTVRELEKVIIDDFFKNDEFHQRQNALCNLLSKFKGFNANGYFTVNHLMLTGMIANIVAYLVILVEFRLDDVPSMSYNDTQY